MPPVPYGLEEGRPMNVNAALVLVSLFAAQEAVAVYCVPTLIAFVRRHPNIGHIALINMSLGWTVAGWVYALVQAVKAADPYVPPGVTPTEERDHVQADSPAPGSWQ